MNQKNYNYPDENDRLTIQLIENEYDNEYWAQSEAHVIDQWMQALSEHSASMLSAEPTDSEDSANPVSVADSADSENAANLASAADLANSESSADSNGRPQLSLLDLGCGTGRLFEIFAGCGFVRSITGVEPDPDRFASARLTAEYIDAPCEVTVINGDASSLPPDSKFDVVLSSHVLQHIRSDMASDLLVQIADLLQPGGIVLLTTTYAYGSHDQFFKESMLEDGSRRSEETDMAGFDEAYSEKGILPVRMFAFDSLQSMSDAAGLDLALYGCYHFAGHSSVSQDVEANDAGSTQNARDSFCILKKR